MNLGSSFGLSGQNHGIVVLAIVIHDSIIIHHLPAVHIDSLLKGAVAVHSIADDDDKVLSFYAGLFNECQQGRQQAVLPFVRGGAGNIRYRDANRKIFNRFAL